MGISIESKRVKKQTLFKFTAIFLFTIFTLQAPTSIQAQESADDLSWFHLPEKKQIEDQKRNDVQIVEDFTAHTLDAGEFKLGLNIDVGIWDGIMVGTSLVSIIAGAPRLQFKVNAWKNQQHSISVMLAGAYADSHTLSIWIDSKKHFNELEAKVIQPGLMWSCLLYTSPSPRDS